VLLFLRDSRQLSRDAVFVGIGQWRSADFPSVRFYLISHCL
jgi:hypothetical protein